MANVSQECSNILTDETSEVLLKPNHGQVEQENILATTARKPV